MGLRLAVVVVVAGAACGRIHFGPVGDDDDNGSGDDVPRDGQLNAPRDSAIDATTACTNALPIAVGVRKASSTCLGPDLIDACGPANTQEVVFAFTSPATAGYNFRAFDAGTNNVTNSTQRLDANCKPVGGCVGVLGIQVAMGDTVYFAVEASAGGCASVEFEAQ